VVAEGRTVQAIYDYAEKRTRPLDSGLRSAIEEFEGREIPPRA
jgi:hypothetical protein